MNALKVNAPQMQQLYFYPKLGDYIPGSSQSKDVVLNNKFSRWESYIRYIFEKRSSYNLEYDPKKDGQLLKLCERHKKLYSKPVKAGNVFMLVHPFYLHLTHMHKLVKGVNDKDAKDYLISLTDFLKNGLSREKAQIVVIDTIHHYSASTSLLLEHGFIDDVIFSRYGKGKINSGELKQYCKKNIFIAGLYNNKCLMQVIASIQKVTKSPQRLFAVYDLILKHPTDFNTSLRLKKSSQVHGNVRPIPQHMVVSLEEAIKKME